MHSIANVIASILFLCRAPTRPYRQFREVPPTFKAFFEDYIRRKCCGNSFKANSTVAEMDRLLDTMRRRKRGNGAMEAGDSVKVNTKKKKRDLPRGKAE